MAISPVKFLVALCALLLSCYCHAEPHLEIPLELTSAAAADGHSFRAQADTPTIAPTMGVTDVPSLNPTQGPSLNPTQVPTQAPSTRAPTITFAPSVAPTLAPTLAPLSLQFSSDITLDNLASLDLSQDDINSILSATAVSMTSGSTVVDVSMLTYKGIKAARRRLSEASAVKVTAVNGIATVQVDYPVTSTTDTTTLYNSLTTNLDAGITSGTFTDTMVAYGAPNTATAEVTTVPTYTEPVVVSNDGGDNNNDLSDGEIAGIVIGSIVGFALLCGIIYYVLLNNVMGSDDTAPVRAQSKGSSFGSRQKRDDVEIAL